ncbi:hypothetical protein GCM10023238_24350 [Streptomyces heliomycini]
MHERWLTQRNAQARVLRHNLLALRATHGVEVRVSFRALPFTPPVKLYLLNGEEALIGYYLLTRREEEWESHTLEMYDRPGRPIPPLPLRGAGRAAGAGVRGGIPEVVRRPLGNHHDGPDALLVGNPETDGPMR